MQKMDTGYRAAFKGETPCPRDAAPKAPHLTLAQMLAPEGTIA
jgi:hypothetical protein